MSGPTDGEADHRSDSRHDRPVPATAARAVLVAAVVSGVPSTLHSLVARRPLLAPVRAAAALVPTRRRGRPATLVGDLLAGGVAHAVVSATWGTVLTIVLARVPRGRRTAAGGLAGVAIHAVDLGLVARVVPRLAPMRALPQLPQLGDHVAFGAAVGFGLDRPRTPPPAS